MLVLSMRLIILVLLISLVGCEFSEQVSDTSRGGQESIEDTRDEQEDHDDDYEEGHCEEHDEDDIDEVEETEDTESESSEEPVIEGITFSYNDRAKALILYTNCISCHNNNYGLDFSAVDTKITQVEAAYADFSIDESGAEAVAVDEAINELVVLYQSEGGGKPFNRTGLDAVGSNMSDKSGVNHTSSEKEELDELEEWIVQENNL